jgi:hypothetical protein
MVEAETGIGTGTVTWTQTWTRTWTQAGKTHRDTIYGITIMT